MSFKEKVPAIGYLRTSSAANVGADKDNDRRQREAIAAFARRAGYELVAEFYDAAVSGADAVDSNSRTHGAMGSAYASKVDYRVAASRLDLQAVAGVAHCLRNSDDGQTLLPAGVSDLPAC
jgi:hypothetical protein